MECPRCHNKNVSRFFKVNGRYYCRNCISFSRVYIDDYVDGKLYKINSDYMSYDLPFVLSDMQRKISLGLKKNYMNKKNSLVLAVCGSGKTEIVFETVMYALNLGHKVCFCTPRKELCKELYQRFQEHFHGLDISLIYGGHIENLDSQFIICTTHQLYRFEHIGFHLVILDEADAFPFYCNTVLEEIFLKCVKGSYIKMSATVEESHNEELFVMNRRYHSHDLPIPYQIILPSFFQRYYLLYYLYKMKLRHKRVLVYVPTVSMVEGMTSFIRNFGFHVEGVHSKTKDIMLMLDRLRKGMLDAIVCTTILERGITIKDIQVIVLEAQHSVFDSRTLIQIAGRVGRKDDAYTGDVCFLCVYRTKEMNRCIYSIKKLNESV